MEKHLYLGYIELEEVENAIELCEFGQALVVMSHSEH